MSHRRHGDVTHHRARVLLMGYLCDSWGTCMTHGACRSLSSAAGVECCCCCWGCHCHSPATPPFLYAIAVMVLLPLPCPSRYLPTTRCATATMVLLPLPCHSRYSPPLCHCCHGATATPLPLLLPLPMTLCATATTVLLPFPCHSRYPPTTRCATADPPRRARAAPGRLQRPQPQLLHLRRLPNARPAGPRPGAGGGRLQAARGKRPPKPHLGTRRSVLLTLIRSGAQPVQPLPTPELQVHGPAVDHVWPGLHRGRVRRQGWRRWRGGGGRRRRAPETG